ncbi:glycosyltransferase family 4 protein [Plantactinospora endophytica]|uniref:Glycosyl hydrolase n=1 Tax=Plantactinospora endophytica TaxID=673535 RepID=A0ABQ4E1F0_9ACTN|nr:glycosyltransferase family 4 protein [Plantactinospora endophytica]GIG88552.1 glycosyl hydrolase [Plantactinospora endophytica]
MESYDATPRHVLFLNWRDTRNPHGGGSEVYVERIAAELVARGHAATLFCAAHPAGPAEETNPAGVRIIRRGGRHTVYMRAALTYLAGWFGLGRLRRGVAGRGRPDLIVDVCNGLPFLSPLWSRRPVIMLVHHVHREQWPVVLPPWAARLGWWIESSLAVHVYRRCRYVTVSAATRRELATLGVDPERVTVVHNGTPESVTAAGPESVEPTLVVLGRLVPHKQVEVALRVLARLAPQWPTLSVVIAGQGWWEPRLREYAAELEVGDRVLFTGFVSDAERDALLSSAWVALTPSLKEGWGLTIVEAGGRGTPTVAFRSAGGVAEAIVHGRTGLLADGEEEFTAYTRALLADDARRTAMGAAARAYAESFTWSAAGEKFDALVRQTAGVGTPVAV